MKAAPAVASIVVADASIPGLAAAESTPAITAATAVTTVNLPAAWHASAGAAAIALPWPTAIPFAVVEARGPAAIDIVAHTFAQSAKPTATSAVVRRSVAVVRRRC